MQNFEALGRYITAEGEARKFASQRNGVLRQASKMIDAVTGGALGDSASGGTMIGYSFDSTPILERISEATEAHRNMVAAIEEANRYAADCGKPQLELRTPRI